MKPTHLAPLRRAHKSPMETTRASIDDIFAMSRKVALTRATFLAYLLPLAVSVYIMGVLVQLNGTRAFRLALLPVLLWISWRAIFVDMSEGNSKQVQLNNSFIIQVCCISMQATVWALARKPIRRLSPSGKRDESDPDSIYTAFWNTWDLILSPRGVGWNSSQGLIVPKPIVETDSRVLFVFLSLVQLAFQGLAMDLCMQAVRVLSPDGFGSIDGGPLFDHTLPFHLEVLRAVFVSFLTIWTAYFALQLSYQVLAIIFVILFQQRPSQWPPIFDSPWLSTSLSELWGRRWHQLLRIPVMVLGARPFSLLFGRLGGLMGAFLISGIVHDIEFRSIGRGGNSVVIIGFWLMNGVGVVLERIWRKITGRRVEGVWGSVWTFGWLTLWGVWVVNEWAKAGRFGMASLPEEMKPSVVLVRSIRRILAG